MRKYISCILILLASLRVFGQSTWTPAESQMALNYNRTIVEEIRTDRPQTISKGITSRFDTAVLYATISRYSLVIGRTDFIISTEQYSFDGAEWGEILLFENIWHSADGKEEVSIKVNIAKRQGKFFIVRMDFDGNIPSLWPPQLSVADSLNAIIIAAIQVKDIKTINKLLHSTEPIDQALLSKTVSDYAAIISDTAFRYSHDGHPPAEVYPFYNGNLEITTSNEWQTRGGAKLFYLTTYIIVKKQGAYATQIVFGSNKKGSDIILFPGGIYKADEDFPPPPPPMPR